MFVVDVTTPQINFEGKDASGRFLLAAVSGRVVGRRARRQFIAAVSSPRSDDFFAQSGSGAASGTPSDGSNGALSPTSPTDSETASENVHWGRRVVAVRLLDAQAHVAPRDVDVYAGVQWLDESLFAPGAPGCKTSGSKKAHSQQEAAHSYLLRQVFKPCRMDLDFTTHIPEKMKIAVTLPSGHAAAATTSRGRNPNARGPRRSRSSRSVPPRSRRRCRPISSPRWSTSSARFFSRRFPTRRPAPPPPPPRC